MYFINIRALLFHFHNKMGKCGSDTIDINSIDKYFPYKAYLIPTILFKYQL